MYNILLCAIKKKNVISVPYKTHEWYLHNNIPISHSVKNIANTSSFFIYIGCNYASFFNLLKNVIAFDVIPASPEWQLNILIVSRV